MRLTEEEQKIVLEKTGWAPIPGREGYEAHPDGHVRSRWTRGGNHRKSVVINGCRLLNPRVSRGGYITVSLRFPGHRGTTISVHKLVALAFIPNPENKPTINHRDGDKTNNRLSNLEWTTMKENIHHSVRILGSKVGDKAWLSKLTWADVWDLRTLSAFGASSKDLSQAFGISQGNVRTIVLNKTWRYYVPQTLRFDPASNSACQEKSA